MDDTTMAPSLSSHFVNTSDGAKLHYYTVGSGPAILVVHGAATYALSHEELALSLASRYTVHLASRRCRGLSGDYPPEAFQDGILRDSVSQFDLNANRTQGSNYTISLSDRTITETYHPTFKWSILEVETADLQTLIAATDSRYIIAVSSGALLVLHALCSSASSSIISRIQKVIIFEPPIIFTDLPTSCKVEGIHDYERDLAQNSDISALVTAMRTVELGPTWIPRRLMEMITWLMVRMTSNAEVRRKGAGGDDRGKCTLGDMAKLIRYDFALLEGTLRESNAYNGLAEHGKDILLLSGSQTTLYLKEGMAALAKLIPTAEHIVVEGVGHELLVNAEMRGQPAKAFSAIGGFFPVD